MSINVAHPRFTLQKKNAAAEIDAIDALLDRLEGVRSRGPGKWSAHCPAHTDKSPSLSIAIREPKILVHCFSGCTAHEIVQAIGCTLADLFTDHRLPCTPRRLPSPPKPPRLDRDAVAFQFDLAALDRRLRADCVLAAVRDLREPPEQEEDLDRILRVLANTYESLEDADRLETLADEFREHAHHLARLAETQRTHAAAARKEGRHAA